MPSSIPDLLLPWEISPAVLAAIALAAVLYHRGSARTLPPVSGARRIMFYLGLFVVYCALQTSWDYYAGHMFFVHRLQHFALHDVGPVLLAASTPAAVLARGLPERLRNQKPRIRTLARPAMRLIFDPWTATAMYIASLIVWIWPQVHFDVMLSDRLYRLMNWSVVLADLPFWCLILDARPYPVARVRTGHRLLMLFAVTLPMMVSGAILGLSRKDLYPVYDVCGRFAPISALMDQQLGGLIIWIPGSLIILIGVVVVLRRMLHQEHAAPSAPVP